jgi:diguanylate cyclase (GGDEF)-like protein/PAS domain S-box-containing protein
MTSIKTVLLIEDSPGDVRLAQESKPSATTANNMKKIRAVLLVEDNPGDARLLREMFNEQGPADTRLTHVSCMADAEKYLAAQPVDIVLLDLGLPDARGLETVRRARAAAPHVTLVVLTGLDDELLAAQSLQEGAQDYLVKGQNETYGRAQGLLRALRYAVERKALEEALFSEKERAQVTLNSIGDAVICTDTNANVTFLNVVAEKLTGWPRDAAVGRPMTEVFQIMGAASGQIALNPPAMPAVHGSVERLPSNRILVRSDGMVIPIEDCVAPIHSREGRETGTVIIFRDVSAARAMAKQLALAAEHDFLTGLPNRMLLNDRIGQAIALAPRSRGKIAILFLDLDGFKYINDSLGHPVGDKLLQSIAKRLIGCVRGSDTVSRQGGDEFVVLLSDLQYVEDAAISSRRILEAIAEAHSVDHHDLHITTCIGVSIYPDDGQDAETLIKNADTAMYQAKENGRASYQFFKPAMNVRAVERQSVEESLRRAMTRHQFRLQYQPKIDLGTGAITGAEALLRWDHPTRGLVSPDKFIPVAEDCGLILPIGAWVLREACTQARRWLDEGLSLATMAVNVSAMEFRDDNFLHGLLAILAETGLDPRYLELELTESVLMKHAESSTSILQTLRDRGIKIAIDDFGTGYSSLSYLRKFSVDTLKIDQSFVRQISTSCDDRAIVTAVIGMARSLKLRVVAEGVETLEELEFLRAHHCDEAQGFYFSRPLPPKHFAELLRAGLPKLREVRSASIAPESESADPRHAHQSAAGAP